jgi:hypothetical protein
VSHLSGSNLRCIFNRCRCLSVVNLNGSSLHLESIGISNILNSLWGSININIIVRAFNNSINVSDFIPSLIISKRMSFEESDIFFKNLAYIPHIRQNHSTFPPVSTKIYIKCQVSLNVSTTLCKLKWRTIFFMSMCSPKWGCQIEF